MAKLLGFQLANKSGENIQGDDDDPTNLPSCGIMTPALAVEIIASLGEGFLLMPIFEGDIEEPDFYYTNSEKVEGSENDDKPEFTDMSDALRGRVFD